MKKTFVVTVRAKKGADISGSKIQTAVWNTDPHPGDNTFHQVDVVESVKAEVEVDYLKPLYALGRKEGRRWMLLDFFNSEEKAANAVKKSVKNYEGCAMKGEFAVLSFCSVPAFGVWAVEGKPVKVG